MIVSFLWRSLTLITCSRLWTPITKICCGNRNHVSQLLIWGLAALSHIAWNLKMEDVWRIEPRLTLEDTVASHERVLKSRIAWRNTGFLFGLSGMCHWALWTQFDGNISWSQPQWWCCCSPSCTEVVQMIFVARFLTYPSPIKPLSYGCDVAFRENLDAILSSWELLRQCNHLETSITASHRIHHPTESASCTCHATGS